MVDVSIVIPTRNRKELLRQTLFSVLGQRNVCLEAIVVDDGSDDGTPAWIEALHDPRVKLLLNDSSQGVASARNRGVSQAGGDWIAFLDDDDLWAPDKLQEQLALARSSRAAWVYSGAVAVDDGLRVISGGPPPASGDAVRELPLRNVIPAGASNVVVRRDLLGAAGSFDPTLRHMADWDLWIRLARLTAPAVVPRARVAYRIHTGNASLDTAEIPAELDVLEQRYADARGGAPIDCAYVYRWIAWNRLRAGDRRGALRAYRQAWRAGDLASLARAAVAIFHPGIARRATDRRRADPWRIEAESWLGTIASSRGAPAGAHGEMRSGVGA